MAKTKEKRKPIRKINYRPLKAFEIDALFVLYDKHRGNMLQMSKDSDCQYRAYNQLNHYCHLYKFDERLAEIRVERAKKVIAGLDDAKVLAIQRAIGLLDPRKIFIRGRYDSRPLRGKNGKPMYYEVDPDYKEIQAAWEIIKTELGEPTKITKGDLTSGGKPIQPTPETQKLVADALSKFLLDE